jgi:hypothetical protein
MTSQHETRPHRDEQAFRRWLVGAARPYLIGVLIALGALSLFLCWFGVSGQSVTAKQLPYLASGGLTGIALFVLAAGLLAAGDGHQQAARIEQMQRKVDDLYALLVEADDPTDADLPATTTRPASAAAPATGFVALPTGTSYHRPGCALIAGKANVVAVDAGAIKARSLTPCRVCDPAADTTG